jgi:ribosomal peptide maturation radical SAM protein 1
MRVLLLNMPFTARLIPNIGISILKPLLNRETGVQCDVRYPSLWLYQREPQGYDAVSIGDCRSLVGEWLFNPLRPPLESFIDKVRTAPFDLALRLDPLVDSFLDDCMERLEPSRYDLIGFSVMFQQLMPSLALARRIKQAYPHVKTVFGGATMSGVMGERLHAKFREVDYVVTGDGEEALPELARRMRDGSSPRLIPGLLVRDDRGKSVMDLPARPFENLDSSPCPDYSDYVGDPAAPEVDDVYFLVEASRGCWWGQKHHCTFCGLNANGLAFRHKRPERVMDELHGVAAQYGAKSICMSDTIAARSVFSDVLPNLKTQPVPAGLIWQTKANLSRRQIQDMAEAGVKTFQPGIESLSSRGLKIKNQGVSVIQGVQTLKWAAEFGIETSWNILLGFPGETEQDYIDMSKVIPLITHLKPPKVASQIRLDRFSPNFEQARELGFRNVRPSWMFQHAYPNDLTPEELTDLAYWFDYDLEDGLSRGPELLRHIVEPGKVWRDTPGDLRAIPGTLPELKLVDTRCGKSAVEFDLNGIERQVYEFCAEIRVLHQIRERFGEVEPFLGRMVDAGFMIQEGGRYLSLALSGPWAA